MRLPKITQLTKEQKKIYLYSPTDKHVLVHGPPGTGKTLIACLRAVELQKRKVPVVLGMFNNVLAQYSSNAAEDCNLPSQTLTEWFYKWWDSSCLPPHPNCSSFALQVPPEGRDNAEAVGAYWDARRWRKWSGGYGAMVVNAENYFAKPEAFKSWRLWHDPPFVRGQRNGIDWSEVANHILSHDEYIPHGSLSLGNMLIDEGQDFPRGFYKTLRIISNLAAARGKEVQHPPRCFVLADENQQLTEENSTLQEIAETLKISEENRYLLLDNFRNSKEIALLARSFFADVGVLPRLPKRQSAKPIFSVVGHVDNVIESIQIWVTNNPGKEVGVFVFDEAKRDSIVTTLRIAFEQKPGRNFHIQTYSWDTRKQNRADNLRFDAPDTITILNMQSCKGLEFDAVFIVDLHQARIGLFGPDRFKMQMFVAVSRAREWVQLMDSGPNAGRGDYEVYLPGTDFLERGVSAIPKPANRSKSDSARPEILSIKPREPKLEPPQEGLETNPLSWQTEVNLIAKMYKLKTQDLRAKGGSFWIMGDAKLKNQLEPLGFNYSSKRLGWWRK